MTNSDLVQDGLATVAQAAQFLSVGRTTVYQLMERGELAFCKIGKARRIPWVAIRELAADTLSDRSES